MKRRIISIFLAVCLIAGLMPAFGITAFAESETITLNITSADPYGSILTFVFSDGTNTVTYGTEITEETAAEKPLTNNTTFQLGGNTVGSYNGSNLYLGIDGGTGYEWSVTVSGTVYFTLFIRSGNAVTISEGAWESDVTNHGEIKGGTFNSTVLVNSTVLNKGGTISDGIFNKDVTNQAGTISGGTFSEKVANQAGTISGGTFNSAFDNYDMISGGTFNGSLDNYSYITVSVGQTLTFGEDCSFTNDNYGKAIVIEAGGTLINNGTFTNDNTFTNEGTFNNNGTFTNNSTFTNNGTFTTSATGFINDSGTFTCTSHTYCIENAVEEYRKSAATCTDAAVYYKSCACGVFDNSESAETFTYGDALNHTWGGWTSTGDEQHSRTCETDPDHTETAVHTEGTAATCTTPATCSVCNQSYGSAGHVWGSWEITSTQHSRTCKTDPNHTEADTHTVGTAATCATAQTCTECGYEIAPATGHSYGADWSKDSSNHWHECSVCGDKKDSAAHTEGEAATCTTAQTCTECGYEIAPATGHSFDNACDTDCNGGCGYIRTITHSYGADWSKDSSNHWHECSVCGDKTDLAAHSFDNACDTDCNVGCGYTRTITHSYEAGWSKDSSNHWYECSVCGNKKDSAAHNPGTAATETTPQTCTVCGYVITSALGHTHTWGSWIGDGDGTHTRTCLTNSSHTSDGYCYGGTATCKDKATCFICDASYGSKDSDNHTGGTEVRGQVDATTTAEGYTGDTYCLGCGTKTATGTAIPKKDGGGSTGGGDNGDDSGNEGDTSAPDSGEATPVTVPVSGGESSIQVDTSVSGRTATIDDVDLSALNTVIDGDVTTGVVTIDFSVLEQEVDTVKIPTEVVKQIAAAANNPNNDAESLEIVLSDGMSIEFDAKALGEKSAQAGGIDITISIKHTTDSNLNNSQQQTVGNRAAYDINVTSGDKYISDMGGKVTVHAPYELRPGEKAEGITVYYVDDNGNRERCETSYDSEKKRVNWKTDHLSVYMIGYEEPQESPDTGDGTPTVPAYVTYTVQKGDTLRAVSKKYGCTIAEIVAANSDLIKNPDLIYPGWQLKIPQAGATGTGTGTGTDTPDATLPDDKKTIVYVVQRGDTLRAISQKYGCTVAELIALNGERIDDPDLIISGWELKIPQE